MNSKTKAAPHTEALEFFSLNGVYQVAPGTSANQLHDDIGCWLEIAGANIDMVIDGMTYQDGLLAANPKMVTSVLYGIRNHLEMVQGTLLASYKLEANVTENDAKNFVTLDRELAQDGIGEFEAAYEILELSWEVMNDATRAKFIKRLKDAGWNVSSESPTRNNERKKLLDELETAIYGAAREDV